MIRLWSAAVLALALAGVVHIVTVQLVPHVAPESAFDRLTQRFGPQLAFHRMPAELAPDELDPAFRYAACLFDLSSGSVSIDVELRAEYWGISLYDEHAGLFYALNNGSAEQNRLTLLVANNAQAGRLLRTLNERNDPRLVVSAPVRRAYAVLKLFVPTPARAAEAEERLRLARCQPADPSLT